MQLNETKIQIAVAKFFDLRINIIIPNVSWGFDVHECDLLIITKAGYAIEVEIKVSISDLKKDLDKWHKHRSNKIKKLYFAIPEPMLDKAIDLIPARAGIIIVKESIPPWHQIPILRCVIHRKAKINSDARAMNDDDRMKLLRLGVLRMWSLKESLCQKKNQERSK